jgi:tRNA U55 pseudouridine synthase TruB
MAADAIRLDTDADRALSNLLPMTAAVAGMKQVTVGSAEVNRLRQGQVLPWTEPDGNDPLAVVDQSGNLIAIVRADSAKKLLRPEKVLVV